MADEAPVLVPGACLFDGAQTIPLYRGANSLGRRPQNQIVLDDELISRLHAWIVGTRDGTWLLLDCCSSNGSYVDGELADLRILRNGNQLLLGSSRFTFFCQAPESPPPPKDGVPSFGGTLQLLQSRFEEILDPPEVAGEAPGDEEVPSGPGLGFDRLLWVHSACRSLDECDTPAELHERFTRLAMEGTGAERGVLVGSEEDPEGGVELTLLANLGSSAVPPWDGFPSHLTEFVTAAWEAGEPRRVDGVSYFSFHRRRHVLEMFPVRAAMAIPRWWRGAVDGALSLDRSLRSADPFTPEDAQVVAWLTAAYDAARDLLEAR